ncbi:hypothetical protein [Guptibacillus algicola]|uniref:hypothetical protein n=1 Tax=Guptibacillus algicola TaxID=225844 RepID=UPI001CD34126|nr:hypothetical protein [Alkalihalobacillus algicola]MCA0988519.1 hypothetical protein [Alkalihalobacillus algicola]
MIAPKPIIDVWRRFDDFPMETLTKAWYFNKAEGNKQRHVPLMKEHHEQFGITGNCFDLALWLLDVFKREGIEAYPIGHDLHTEDAHVAVVVKDESGKRYLCDLGDQWLNPVLIDSECEDYSNELLDGYFPAARVQVLPQHHYLKVIYHRPNEKWSEQVYDTRAVVMEEFLSAAEHSQNVMNKAPLLECRIPYKKEIAHWEFYNWESVVSTTEGLHLQSKVDGVEEWATKIHEVSGYDREFLIEALEIYKKRGLVERG